MDTRKGPSTISRAGPARTPHNGYDRGGMTRVQPRQSLGQNFLVDDNIARKIVRSLRLEPDDVVVEIGPGEGALTVHLATAVKTLVAVEVDERVIAGLTERIPREGVTILHRDFLEVSLRGFQR